jgi:hypothetical protein
MKANKKKLIILLLGMSILTGVFPPFGQMKANAQPSVSFQVFYDQLAPFGSWVDYPNYGYVWVPSASGDFRPYASRGHWVYADEGWTWVSDYSWGWATFHYGNWFYDNTYGWIWVPGYEWAPAWVTWGEYDGNYCWAPIGPRIDIGVSFGTYRPPYNYWSFCPREHITSVNINHYYVNVHNTRIVNNITVINNVSRGGGRPTYLRGPAPSSVERFTHTPIHPVAIQNAARPGAASVQHGQLAIYHPVVRNFNAGVKPSRVQDLHALRPANNSSGPAPVAHAPVAHAPLGNAPSRGEPASRTARTPAAQMPRNQPAPMQHNPVAHTPDHPAPVQRPAFHPAQQPQQPQHSIRQPATARQVPPPQRVAPQQQHMQPVHQAPPHPVHPMGAPVVRNPQPQPQGNPNPHEHHR